MLTKQSLLQTFQSLNEWKWIIKWIYEVATSTPNTGNTTIKDSQWSFIPLWLNYVDIENNQIKKQLTWFLLEWEIDSTLNGEYYQMIMI